MLGSPEDTWGIVLSGGDGCRLQHFTEQLYGCKRPKQYCAIVGTRTMLRHTIDRAELVIAPKQLVTIIDKSHLPYAEHELHDRPEGNIIIQPCNRDTGPGILHAVLHIHRRNRNAQVVILPSDHFIKEEESFMEHVRTAVMMAKVCPDIPILIGVNPCCDETEYGWIEPGDRIAEYRNMSLSQVRSFWEKPEKDISRSLHRDGCLWNTMILVANVQVLLKMFRVHTPEIYQGFAKVRASLGSSAEESIVEELYSELPSVNFSTSILEPSAKQFGVLPVEGAYWSDWGQENRIRIDAERFNLRLKGLPAPRANRLHSAPSIDLSL